MSDNTQYSQLDYSKLSPKEAEAVMQAELNGELILPDVAAQTVDSNMSPEEAEAIMQAELNGEQISSVAAIKSREGERASTERVSVEAMRKSGHGMSYEKYANKSLAVFHQINDMMGDFFDSIKPLNSAFQQYADAYYLNAHNIAENSKKRELTEQEFDDMVGNILAGAVVTGVGQLWETINTQIKIEDVKKILRTDAKLKKKTVKSIKKDIGVIVDAACEQYDLCVSRGTDFADLHEKFDAMRLALYSQKLVLFLDATYEAAEQNSFQNEYPYPTLYEVNELLFDWLLNLNEKHSSVEAKTNYYRKEISRVIGEIETTIETGETPTPAAVLLAMDPGLMAVAIYKSNPVETIGYTDDDEITGADINTIEPECADYLIKYYHLYVAGRDNASSSLLAEYVYNNEALKEGVQHILQLLSVPHSCKKRMLVININLLLGGALGFIVSMRYGLAWYWSLLIGVIAFLGMVILSPAKATTRKFMTKLIYVERAVKITALQRAGYQESIDLHAIQSKNNKGCSLAFIGFLIGLPFIGVGGPLWGALLGFCVAKFLSKDRNENEEYDYNAVDTGSGWKGYIVTALLTFGIAYTVLTWVSGSSYGDTDIEAVTDATEKDEEETEENISKSSHLVKNFRASTDTKGKNAGSDVVGAVTSGLRMSGEAGGYPVVFILNFDGDKVTGKYAYKKILSRYGDGPQSYMYLTGYLTSDNTLKLVSRAYRKNEDLERISLPLTSTDSGSFVSGELRNVNTGEVLPLELRVE